MSSILRNIFSGPCIRDVETGLDLCYISEKNPTLIAMAMPAATFPVTLYRNPLSQVLSFLNSTHGSNWHIWELRAEGTGYKDEDFEGRVYHAPFPDHHPPPFALIPKVMGSMKMWVDGKLPAANKEESNKHEEREANSNEGKAIVVHCKAGKGRSGTILSSYLISEHGFSAEEALARFTRTRMRPEFGTEGVSIPSQRRYVLYVERWARQLDKVYIERNVQVTELRIWGLRDGVRISIGGYVEGGKRRRDYWRWSKGKTLRQDEEEIVDPEAPHGVEAKKIAIFRPHKYHHHHHNRRISSTTPNTAIPDIIALETSDINISFERHVTPPLLDSTTWTVVTSVAHVWLNAYFESLPKEPLKPDSAVDAINLGNAREGTFTISWEEMDGIKGTSTKGTKCFTKMRVSWEFLPTESGIPTEPVESKLEPPGIVIHEGDMIEDLRIRSDKKEAEKGEGIGNKEEETTLGIHMIDNASEADENACSSSSSSTFLPPTLLAEDGLQEDGV